LLLKCFVFLRFSDPTPDGVTLLDGIPKFLPYNSVDEFYTAIDDVWRSEADYTLTYTVTVDELNPPVAGRNEASNKRRSGRFQRPLSTKNNYRFLGYY
jgi:hypothetical protein